jgi:hypothetical protein
MFAADHGEYGAAHGMMMEKWHTAYQEALAVPVVFSDSTELHNLVSYADIDQVMPNPPAPLTEDDVREAATRLRSELERQEAALLSPYPSAYPSARSPR